jgi:hypothetical protein
MLFVEFQDHEAFDAVVDFFDELAQVPHPHRPSMASRGSALALGEFLDLRGYVVSRRPDERPDHPQVRVTCAAWEADVDETLAPLIEAIWRQGVPTAFSCQGNFGQAYISVDREHLQWLAATAAEASAHVFVDADNAESGNDWGLASIRFPTGDIEAVTNAVRRGSPPPNAVSTGRPSAIVTRDASN